ncbi:BTAD domain-containing putative transcriptional regulator [Nocardia sp. NPDC058518]|uniref:AfsR/SARP family transcriptional regulator n=1 Tax=Nocardia sp. NPDC058518 TaxID=3346534 RepID=UPI003667CFCB
MNSTKVSKGATCGLFFAAICTVVSTRRPSERGLEMLMVDVLGQMRIRTDCDREGGSHRSSMRQVVDNSHMGTALAIFACSPGRVVEIDHLIELMWHGRPTRTARQSVHVQVSKLRRIFTDLGGDGSAVIRNARNGYLLDDRLVTLDVQLFTEQVRQAHSAHRLNDAAASLKLFDNALAHWHGKPFSGIDLPRELARHSESIERIHLSAREGRVEVLINMGAGRELIPELESLIGHDPFQEFLHGCLMIALSRSGRRGEALRLYQNFARHLHRELGIPPGAEIRHIFETVLSGRDVSRIWVSPLDHDLHEDAGVA